MTSIITLLLFFIFPILSLSSQIIYVNEQNPHSNNNGSQQNPYSTIDQAISNLLPGYAEIILLGSSITLSSAITFPVDVICTIRPETVPASGYFPLKIQINSNLTIYQSNVTFESLHIIELDKKRDSATNVFTVISGLLCLNRSMVSDILYPATGYWLVFAGEQDNPTTEVALIDSVFKNLKNLQIFVQFTKITVKGSTFSNIHMNTKNTGGFITIFDNTGNNLALDVISSSISDSSFGYTESGLLSGFIRLNDCVISIYFQDFYVKNITMTNSIPLVWIVNGVEDPQNPTSIQIYNLTVDTATERKDTQASGSQSTGVGLLFDITGTSKFVVDGLSLNKVRFRYDSVFRYSPDTTYFLYPKTLSTSASFSNIQITDSSNTNFLVFKTHYSTLKNVTISNSYCYCITSETQFPLFYFEIAYNVTAQNIEGNKIYGPLLKMNCVLNQMVQDFFLTDITTSQRFDKSNQNIIQLVRDDCVDSAGLNTVYGALTSINNFNVNGFSSVTAKNCKSESNDTYMIVATLESGRVIIQDSRWYNIFMGSFLSTAIDTMTINNLIVDADPYLSPKDLPWRRIFQIVNVNSLEIINSKFLNNQNIVLFNFFNIDRSAIYSSGKLINLVFNNITLTNNFANYTSTDTLYLSHFLLNSPLKPFQVSFKNSYFQGNKISNGLISTLESYQVAVTIQDCIFEDNYAGSGGAAFAAQTMQDNKNTLTLVNNTFQNNIASNNGGVFSFINTWFNIEASENKYFNNNASGSGGVGYLISTKLIFQENNAHYQNNSAGKLGGAWYLSENNQQNPETRRKPISFTNSIFKNSQASQSQFFMQKSNLITSLGGGAISIALSDLELQNCQFSNNKATISGGDIYLLTFSSLAVNNSNFTQSFAPMGSVLYADSLSGETIAIEKSLFYNFNANSLATSLISLNSGWLEINSVAFLDINIPLFSLEATSAKLTDVLAENINCTSSSSFCILQGISMSVELQTLKMANIASNSDLIVLNSPFSNTTINAIQVQKVTSLQSNSNNARNSQKQLFALRITSGKNVTLADSYFYSFVNFSSILADKSALLLMNSDFYNKPTERQLFALTSTKESSDTSGFSSSLAQFLVFSASNVSIIQSSFSYNSGIPQINGGAMRILGNISTQGNYNILNSTFKGNQGLQGGAISAEGQFNSLNIENTNFTSNQANISGGSIYFADECVRLVPKIDKSIFKDNQAQTGGAIFVGNQPLYVQSSTFTSNSARDGGAIASFSESSEIITLMDSLFEKNTAKVGAALRALGTTNFDSATSKFVGNVAEIGGVLATNPTQLGLIIYQVADYFLFLDDIDPSYMLSHPETEIVYDSKDSAYTGDILLQSPGRNPNYLYKITFLDQLGENLPIIEQAMIQTSIKNYLVTRGSITPSLLGRTSYKFNSTNGYLFNSFSIRGNQSSSITLSFQGIFNNTYINQLEKLTSLDLKVNITSCSLGEYYDESNLLCTPCPVGTYCADEPCRVQNCTGCPDSMTCLGGRIYFPVKGYWRMTETSDNIIPCFNNEACLGGIKDEGKNISLTGFCGKGYHGIACANCDSGYAKFGTSQKCINCSKNAGYYIRFLSYLVIQILIIIFATRVFLKKLSPNKQDKQLRIIQAALIKIVIDFVQVLNLTSEFNFRWPNEIGDFLEAITKVTPTNKDALSVDCFISLIKGDNHDVLFIKFLLLVLQPLFFIAMATAVWMVIFRVRKEQILSNSQFRLRLLVTSAIIIYILQPGIIKSTFQLFNCSNFGSEDDPQNYLVDDTNVKCWEPKHITWTLALGIPSLIIWLIIPTGLLLYVIIRKRFTKSAYFTYKYRFIFDQYREKTFYWELLILLRKVGIIIFASFLTLTYLQAYLSFLVIIVAFALQTYMKPFVIPSLNSTEKLSLFTSGFILYTGLFFVRAERMESLVPLLLALDTIIGVFFLLYCLYVSKIALQGRLVRLKQKFMKAILRTKPIPKSHEKAKKKAHLILDKPLDSETDLFHKETEIYSHDRLNMKSPSLVHLIDKNSFQIGKIGPRRSGSGEYNEESSSNSDPYLRTLKSLDSDVRLFSVRGTESELLQSGRADSSIHRRGSYRHSITGSQILDLEDEKILNKINSLHDVHDLHAKGGFGLDIVVEEPPTATLRKEMLLDERFKEVDRLRINHIRSEGASPIINFAQQFYQSEGKRPYKRGNEEVLVSRFDDNMGLFEEEEKEGFKMLRKETLKDERFKNLDRVKIHFEEEEEDVVTEQKGIEYGEEEIMSLSALKEGSFENSLDEKVQEEILSLNDVDPEGLIKEEHEKDEDTGKDQD